MSYLEIHDQVGTRWLPAGNYFTFGRSLQNHVVLQGQAVSRNHARIVLQGNGAIVEDLGSTYGTLVNGLYVRGWKALENEDRIQMGDVLVVYHEGQRARVYDSDTPAFGTPRPAPELPRNMVRCPYCSTANLKSNSVCYRCGNPLLTRDVVPQARATPLAPPRKTQRRSGSFPWGMAVLVVLLIVVLCLLSLLVGIILAGGPLGSLFFGSPAP